MRTPTAPLLLCLSLVLVPLTVRADWDYTRWGMTPEQVAGASKGAVKALPPGKRDQQGAVESGASGSGTVGAVKVSLGFLFDAKSHGLLCVVATVPDPATAALLETELVKRLGAPKSKSGDPATFRSVKWRTAADEIELTVLVRGASQAMWCKPGAQFY